MEKLDDKKVFIIFSVSIVLMMLLILFFSINTKKINVANNEESQSESNVKKDYLAEQRNKNANLPMPIKNIPTLSVSEGKGVDIASDEVVSSKTEISKLSEKLPFNKKITTSKGLSIEIMIPEQKLQDNDFSLTVYIFGINYEVENDSRDYLIQKVSFQEGAKEVFSFLKQNNIDVTNLIVRWGDRKKIRDKAENWLLESVM